MGVYTSIKVYRAANTKREADVATEDGEPGVPIEILNEDHFADEDGSEYGSWTIDLSKLPSEATHIRVWRG